MINLCVLVPHPVCNKHDKKMCQQLLAETTNLTQPGHIDNIRHGNRTYRFHYQFWSYNPNYTSKLIEQQSRGFILHVKRSQKLSLFFC